MANFKKWLDGEEKLFSEDLDEQIEETKITSIDKRILKSALSGQEKQKIIKSEINGISILHMILAIVTFVIYIFILIINVTHLGSFGNVNMSWNYVARYYIEHSLFETKSVNSITGMILDYRAFDTLGESFVLFSAVTCVMVLLNGLKDDEEIINQNRGFLVHHDPIVKLIATILMPIIFVFGIYIIINGHLSPGGGFSGGAIIGAGLILFSLAFGEDMANRFFKLKTFKTITSLALCGYAITKCYSFLMGGMHYYDPISNFFHSFANGSIISGGYILILNICVGLIVACTMYGFYCLFKRGEI